MSSFSPGMTPEMLTALLSDPATTPAHRMAAMKALNQGPAQAAPPQGQQAPEGGLGGIDQGFMEAVRKEMQEGGDPQASPNAVLPPDAQQPPPQQQQAPQPQAPQGPLMQGAAEAKQVAQSPTAPQGFAHGGPVHMRRGGAMGVQGEGMTPSANEFTPRREGGWKRIPEFIDRSIRKYKSDIRRDDPKSHGIPESLNRGFENLLTESEQSSPGGEDASASFIEDGFQIGDLGRFKPGGVQTNPQDPPWEVTVAEDKQITPNGAQEEIIAENIVTKANINDVQERQVEDPEGAEADFQKQMKDLLGSGKASKEDKWMALLKASLGTMEAASKPGATALGSIGAGGGKGLESLDDLRKERAVERMKKAALAQSAHDSALDRRLKREKLDQDAASQDWDESRLNPRNMYYKAHAGSVGSKMTDFQRKMKLFEDIDAETDPARKKVLQQQANTLLGLGNKAKDLFAAEKDAVETAQDNVINRFGGESGVMLLEGEALTEYRKALDKASLDALKRVEKIMGGGSYGGGGGDERPDGVPRDARQAPNGNWYTPDPKSPGIFLQWP